MIAVPIGPFAEGQEIMVTSADGTQSTGIVHRDGYVGNVRTDGTEGFYSMNQGTPEIRLNREARRKLAKELKRKNKRAKTR